MKLLRRLHYLLHRRRREAELSEEMEHHRALAEQEQREAGLDEEEARRAAALRMGNATVSREDARQVWFPAAIEGILRDVRYAGLGLARNKTLLVVACLSLGSSTGFGTALFSVVNAVILQPVTASRPEALVRLWLGNHNRTSAANLRDICEQTPAVACAGYRIDELMWYPDEEAVRVFAQVVSPDYFRILGVRTGQGRVFTKESVREAPDSVVVTHAFWERRLAADPDVVGRRLVLTGHPYTVIGVLPRGFRSVWGLGISPSVYLPLGSAARPFTEDRSDQAFEILAVLQPGQNAAELEARVLARAQDLEKAYPEDNKDLGHVQIFPVHEFGLFMAEGGRESQVILLFASFLLLFALTLALVACINVAGMLVARAIARQREISIRLSIGCGRARLARLLLAESLLLAIAGVGSGALLSVWLSRMLVATPLPFPVPFEAEIPIDTHLFLYLAALVGMVTLAAGVAPVLQAWRVSVVGAVGRSPSGLGFRRWSGRGMLIAAQVALSTVLLIATTLFLRSLWVASQVDPGFEIDRVVTVEADTRSQQMSEAETTAYYRDALARLKGLPEVTGVSAAAVVPLSLDVIVNGLTVDRGGQEQHVKVSTNIVLPDYFRVMGIPLLRGRDLTEADRQATPRAVIVNETFARQVFPGENAIGQRVRRPAPPDKAEPWAEIVGVAADSRYMTLGEQTQPQVYWPFAPDARGMKLHVRTEGDAGALARALPEVLRSMGGPPVSVRIRPLRDVMAVALFPAQAAATVLATLGLVGWALTVAGIYGVVSYGVTRRIPEIGMRLALGATPSNVMRLLLRDGVAVTLAGLTVGLALAATVAPQLATFLAGVSPHDAMSFAAVAAVFVATALAASYGPARRGTRLSPTEALRSE